METIITVAFLFVSLALIALILVQHGKGADAGAAFGSGASATVFGAQGAGNFLTRTTAILATAFFILSLSLGWFAIHTKTPPALIIDQEDTTIVPTAKSEPAKPVIDNAADLSEIAIPKIPTENIEAAIQAVDALPEIPITSTETKANTSSVPSIPE